MSGDTFGDLFKVTESGESHGKQVGAIVAGCPPCLELDMRKIQYDMDRRKPGQSSITTQRKESDIAHIFL